MLYDKRIENNTSESIVIDLLSKKPRLTTGELYDFYIPKAKKKITVQGFYKLVRQMLDRRILVKEGTHLSLDSFWINNWVTAIGDFIFEARIPKYIFEIIEKIYDEINSLAEYNAKEINNLFFEPGKAKLVISRDKKRADGIREEVKELYNRHA